MKYTAGPWKYEITKEEKFDPNTGDPVYKKFWLIKNHKNEYIGGSCKLSDVTDKDDSFYANAQLMATAPEMFELLEDLVEIMPTALHNGHHDLIERTKTIIKKAKGEL